MRKKLTRKQWLAILGILVPSAALAAGIYTNGMQGIGALTVNGTASSPSAGLATQLYPNANYGFGSPLVPVDTNFPSGSMPQTVAASPIQIAATFAEMVENSAVSTAGAATLNTLGGLVVTESLSTAPGATYTFTLTNSLITAAGPAPQVAIYSYSNTGGQGKMQLKSVTNAAGSSVFVWTNQGTTALNGTMVVAFHL